MLLCQGLSPLPSAISPLSLLSQACMQTPGPLALCRAIWHDFQHLASCLWANPLCTLIAWVMIILRMPTLLQAFGSNSDAVQVNATGVMPVIFATSLLSLPQAVARYQPALVPVANALGPAGPLYLPVSCNYWPRFHPV